MNLTRKILTEHLAKPSEMAPGDEIYIRGGQLRYLKKLPDSKKE